MIIDFTQGIITYPTSLGQQDFLTYASSYVSLKTINGRTDVVFAHGIENYLFTEASDVTNAWGPLSPNTDYWLYWDINLLTAVRTFGFTTLVPIVGSIAPVSPTNGQHWFDTFNKKMFVYNGVSWIEVVRVFAAKINNSVFTSLGTSLTLPYAGTQVGLTGSTVLAGRIIVDDTGTPIRRANGLFFTSEDEFFVNGSPVNTIRLEANIVNATAKENVARYQVVKYTSFGHVHLATYNDTQTTMIAMAMEDLLINESGTLCVQGVITNPLWNFATVGARLWIDSISGLMTETNPHLTDPIAHPFDLAPVGRVLTQTSIFFDQGLGSKGDKGDAGAVTPKATDTIYGIAKLSVAAASAANPIVVGDNDPRLVPYVHPATHPATMITTTSYGNLTGLNAQAMIQQLEDLKVAKAGDTMTGFLTLSANPTSSLHAATKDYVDTRVLDNLADVIITTPASTQVLQFNGTNWVNATLNLTTTLASLTDVTLTSPVSGQVLQYNGTTWINAVSSDPNRIFQQDTSLTILDTGTDSNIELKINNVSAYTNTQTQAVYKDPNQYQWVGLYGDLTNTNDDNWNTSCAYDSQGNILIGGGEGLSPAFMYNATVTKISPTGSIIWQRRIVDNDGVTGSYTDNVIVGPNDSVYINGNVDNTIAGARTTFLAKYDSAGTLLWVKSFTFTDADVSSAVANFDMVVDSAGNAYMLQVVTSSIAPNYAQAITKIDTNGNIVYSTRLNYPVGATQYKYFGLVIDPTNTYLYMCGNSTAGGNYGTIRRVIASTGMTDWSKTFTISGTTQGPFINDLAYGADGNLYLLASYVPNTDIYHTQLLIKLDTTGAALWTTTARIQSTLVPGRTYADPLSIAMDSQLNIYTNGWSNDSIYMMKLNSSGAPVWAKEILYAQNPSGSNIWNMWWNNGHGNLAARSDRVVMSAYTYQIYSSGETVVAQFNADGNTFTPSNELATINTSVASQAAPTLAFTVETIPAESAMATITVNAHTYTGSTPTWISYVTYFNSYTNTNQTLTLFDNGLTYKQSSLIGYSNFVAIDASKSNFFTYTCTGNTTWHLYPSISSHVSKFTLKIVAGAFTQTWPSSIVWHGGSAPTLSAAAAGNLIEFETFDGGTTWYGTLAWAPTAGGGASITVTDDTTTNAFRYPVFTNITSGTMTTANVSSTKLQYNPSTGTTYSTYFQTTSDLNLKTNIQPIDNALNIVNQINEVGFDWKDNNHHSYGVIAQEVEAIIPEAVTENADGFKTVNYDMLIPFLIGAVKELTQRLALLENK